ncbi:MAG: AraC family transcriptional regulator [Bacteroidales bacterium]|nr:AraC family transcriptional regulator [Bacteroidales bacterium]
MTTIIAVSVIVELSAFLLYDSFRNRGNGSLRLAIRLAAGIAGIILVLIELLQGGKSGTDILLMDMMVATEMLLMYPCSYEKPSFPLKTELAAGIIAVFYSAGFPFLFPGSPLFRSQRMVLTFIYVMAVFTFHHSAVACRRLRGIRLFFRNSAVWHSIEDYARFLYSMAFVCLGTVSSCAMTVPGDAGLVMTVVCTSSFMALYALLYLRALTGRTLVVDPRTEDRIKDIIKGNLRTSFIDKAEEDRKMNNLYRKVMFLMTEKKPYLDPSFCMNDLAEQVYSNKLYVSKTINILSGRNFRQFLNYHRIQHAMALFRKDPRLKVSEAAEMSGFNSTVSFNMAFKVNTGKTPSEWMQEHVRDQDERLASF